MSTDFDYKEFSLEMMDCLDYLKDEFIYSYTSDSAAFWKSRISSKFERLFELYKVFEEKW